MATLTNALNFARAIALTDSNGLTDANGLIFANEALLDFRRRLVTKGVDAAQTQEAYADMSANVGTYAYPTDMLWLKAIELNYSGAVQQSYVTATQVDVSNLPNRESFGSLRSTAATNSPQFDDRGDWFEIFPTPTSTNSQGIRIFYFLEPVEFTSVSDSISYPESLDYRILGFRIAANFHRSLSNFANAQAFDGEYTKKVDEFVSVLARGTQQPVDATGITWTGNEF